MIAEEFYPMILGLLTGATLFNLIMVLILAFMLKEHEERIKKIERGDRKC